MNLKIYTAYQILFHIQITIRLCMIKIFKGGGGEGRGG